MRVVDVESWLRLNKNKLGSKFEEAFVRNVLAYVKDIDFDSIQAQYHFTDLDKANRYCDFVIKEGTVRIAIEIDGYSKRNTGGMSHDEFIDWQRRQAALTAQGWYVLRFANRDVMQHPERCRRYIELLLQDQRSKSQNQQRLESTLQQMREDLLIAQAVNSAAQHNEDTAKNIDVLQQEILLLTQQLGRAKKTRPLSNEDKQEVERLIHDLEAENKALRTASIESEKQKEQLELKAQHMQHQGLQLGKENTSMRTTVWAFTAIICLLIVSAVYLYVHEPKHVTSAIPEHVEHKNIFCKGAVPWSQAKNYVGQQIQVKEQVLEYRYMPHINGQPTWINIGEKYPSNNRLALVVWGDDRENLKTVLSADLVGLQVCVTGIVSLFDQTPQIVVKNAQQLLLE